MRGWRRLRYAAHEFGFAGHFITKSRRHKVTFGQRRQARATFTRRAVTSPAPPPGTDQPPQEPTTLQVNFLAFVGAGWRNPADAMLATLPQALAREHQRAAQTELATHT